MISLEKATHPHNWQGQRLAKGRSPVSAAKGAAHPRPATAQFIYYGRNVREGFGLEMTPLCREVIRRMTGNGDAPRFLARFADEAALHRFAAEARRHFADGRVPGGTAWPEVFPHARMARFRLKEPLPDAMRDGVLLEADRHVPLATTKVFLPFSGGTALAYDPAKKIPWGIAAIGAPRLWRTSRGRRVKIAVVDTGADYRHPDILHALRKGINILHPGQPAEDDNGHGTHIAGTIAAGALKPSAGIRGVAPGAEIYPVKAFDREGSAHVSDIVLAIHWCLANKMDIINMSFGMSDHSAALQDAVREAWTGGVTVVASSGNGGKKDEVDFPARSPWAIAVGALNRKKRIASFSNSGKEVDIYAPGEAIYSAWPRHRYNELNGTSMAAAHVSGALALILSKRPGMTPASLRRAIVHSACPLARGPARRPGRLNAPCAFAFAMRRAGVAATRKPAALTAGRPSPARRQAGKTLKTAASGRKTGQTKTARQKPKRSFSRPCSPNGRSNGRTASLIRKRI